MSKKQKRRVSQTAAPAARKSVANTPTGESQPLATQRPAAPRVSTPRSSRSTMLTMDFNPDYSYVIKDLKKIGILAGTFVTILVILSFFLR